MKNTDIILTLCPPFWNKLPPLGLASLVTYLKDKDFNAEALDLNIKFYRASNGKMQREWDRSCDFEILYSEQRDLIEETIAQISGNNARFVSFSLFRSNRSFSIKLASEIKKRCPDRRIIFGGPEVMFLERKGFNCAGADLSEIADFFIVGEGEKPLENILRSNGEGTSKVIRYEQVEDINNLPSPSFSEFDLKAYTRQKGLPMLGSRGCLRRCSFCTECMLHKGFRVKDAARMADEIEKYKETYGISWVSFHDSLINGDLDNLARLCDLMIERNLGINWDGQVLIRRDMPMRLLEKMRQAGCFNIFIGLESGSDKILHLMRKGFDAYEAKEFFKKCHAAGLNFETSLIVDFPGEGENEFQETCDFILKNKNLIPKIAQVNPFIDYFGPERLQPSFTKVQNLIALFEKENVKYTPSFINNLICA